MNVKNNIERFRQTLPAACRLIAVSKTQPVEKIQEAYTAGQRLFGENKAQELTSKYESLPKDIEWHMIGHLQSNKVKYIVPFVHLIHSIDSLKLLAEVDKQAQKVNRVVDCLLQVHIASEDTKFGFSESEVLETLQTDQFKSLKNIRIQGLMGMASLTNDQAQIRREFKSMKALFDKIKTFSMPSVNMNELSMGMSSDYKIAIEEGSTLIRVGTAIFGDRNYKI
jgi:pyridoxal phosphate enzyme (YggS family)